MKNYLMNQKLLAQLLNGLVAIVLVGVFMPVVAADDVEDPGANSTTPFQFSSAKLAGQDLPEIPYREVAV